MRGTSSTTAAENRRPVNSLDGLRRTWEKLPTAFIRRDIQGMSQREAYHRSEAAGSSAIANELRRKRRLAASIIKKRELQWKVGRHLRFNHTAYSLSEVVSGKAILPRDKTYSFVNKCGVSPVGVWFVFFIPADEYIRHEIRSMVSISDTGDLAMQGKCRVCATTLSGALSLLELGAKFLELRATFGGKRALTTVSSTPNYWILGHE